MTSIPDQFQAQLKFIQSFTRTAVDGAEKMLSLNLAAGRGAFSHSSETVRALMQASGPADLVALSVTRSQPQVERLLAYGRELFDIASSTHAALLNSATTAGPKAKAAPTPAAAAAAPAAAVAAPKPAAVAVAAKAAKPAAAKPADKTVKPAAKATKAAAVKLVTSKPVAPFPAAKLEPAPAPAAKTPSVKSAGKVKESD
jgi:phasin family protein